MDLSPSPKFRRRDHKHQEYLEHDEVEDAQDDGFPYVEKEEEAPELDSFPCGPLHMSILTPNVCIMWKGDVRYRHLYSVVIFVLIFAYVLSDVCYFWLYCCPTIS